MLLLKTSLCGGTLLFCSMRFIKYFTLLLKPDVNKLILGKSMNEAFCSELFMKSCKCEQKKKIKAKFQGVVFKKYGRTA